MNKIPSVIYQTWHTNISEVNEKIRETINKMRELNPTYEYKFFNDDDMNSFVLENFNGDIVECYNRLNHKAAKTDFWRYLILYKHGGVYIDIDATTTVPLNTLIQENDDAILSVETVGTLKNPLEKIDRSKFFDITTQKNNFINWGMMFSKEHPILKKTIEFVIHNVKTGLYHDDVFNITGPPVLTRAVQYIHLKTYNHAIDIYELEKDYKDYDYSFSFNNFSYRIYGFNYNDLIIHKYENYYLLHEIIPSCWQRRPDSPSIL